MGDSIAWGFYDPGVGGWANRLRNYFEEKDRDSEIYNLGIPGDDTVGLLDHLEVEARAREPEIIVLAIGINDAQFIHSTNSNRISDDDFKKNLKRIYTVAKKFTPKIIFVGPTMVNESKTKPIPWSPDKSYFNKNIKRLEQIIEIFCLEKKLKFISVNSLLGDEDLDDGLHPNTQGHVKLFLKIKSEIEVYIGK